MLRTWPVLVAVMCAAGCVRHTQRVQPERELTPAQNSFENAWQASRWALEKYYFTIDQADRRSGTISTGPLTGKQAFEFWRRDAVTWDDTYENTVQTIYRIATVTIKRTGPDGKTFKPEVRVIVGRSDKPTRSTHTLTDVYNLGFVEPLANARTRARKEPGAVDQAVQEAARTGQPVTPAHPYWLTVLGRDEILERDILITIEEAANERSYMGGITAP